MRKWYVIRCKPHKELAACLNFEQQGYTVYLPRIKKQVKHARKVKEVYKPFFPGYLFMQLSLSEHDWHPLFSTRGAIGPVSFGKEFVPVPDWVINSLRANEEKPGIIAPGKIISKRLRLGDKVEVDFPNGSIGKGEVFSIDGDKNVIILLDMLKRRVRTRVPMANIRVNALAAV